jgi:hypothetical protein
MPPERPHTPRRPTPAAQSQNHGRESLTQQLFPSHFSEQLISSAQSERDRVVRKVMMEALKAELHRAAVDRKKRISECLEAFLRAENDTQELQDQVRLACKELFEDGEDVYQEMFGDSFLSVEEICRRKLEGIALDDTLEHDDARGSDSGEVLEGKNGEPARQSSERDEDGPQPNVKQTETPPATATNNKMTKRPAETSSRDNTPSKRAKTPGLPVPHSSQTILAKTFAKTAVARSERVDQRERLRRAGDFDPPFSLPK